MLLTACSDKIIFKCGDARTPIEVNLSSAEYLGGTEVVECPEHTHLEAEKVEPTRYYSLQHDYLAPNHYWRLICECDK